MPSRRHALTRRLTRPGRRQELVIQLLRRKQAGYSSRCVAVCSAWLRVLAGSRSRMSSSQAKHRASPRIGGTTAVVGLVVDSGCMRSRLSGCAIFRDDSLRGLSPRCRLLMLSNTPKDPGEQAFVRRKRCHPQNKPPAHTHTHTHASRPSEMREEGAERRWEIPLWGMPQWTRMTWRSQDDGEEISLLDDNW